MSEGTPFVGLFVGFLLSATGVHASCPIELSPRSVVVRYGDSVSVNCSTSESQIEGMGWEAVQGGMSLDKVNHLAWTVENLTDWTISPTCFLNLSPDGQCQKKPTVVLYTFPETIGISSSSGSRGGMDEGKEYNFTCHIHNIAPVQNLTVMWYKGDAMIDKETSDISSVTPVNHLSVLSFKPTRKDNGATFRCKALLDLSPEGPQLIASSQEFNITVYFGPESRCFSLEQLEILEGETLENACHVTGRPSPSVRWLKANQPTDPAVPLKRTDAGWYTVEAEGAVLIPKDLLVYVLYGPELKCPDTYTAMEDAPHNLSCNVRGYPKPEIIWYKDGEEVELPENFTRDDTGQYLITASTALSSVNHTVDINVIYPPSQIVELEDSDVPVGSTVRLKCSSMGNPRPRYSWDYYQATNVVVENEDGVSSLHIHNATAYNMGSYTCHASNDGGNVSKTARVTVKETPDSVSIRPVGDSSSVVEQRELQLRCDITGVAPAANVAVRWFRGNETLEPLVRGSLRVTGCQPQNDSTCDPGAVRSPLNVSSTISITLNKTDNGVEFRCEAQLDLGPRGPQTPPKMMSSPFNVTVYYKPTINTTKLPKTIPVFNGYPEELVCEADGHPAPKIQWLYGADNVPRGSGDTIFVSEAGVYNCTASNQVDSIYHEVNVILKEDYLPLIAGFVAVTVIVISIIFVFIFSIYYKNTKMRRYSLKNPKLETPSSNVAHNGWDMQFPMTKLS
ncbi:basal cell adhesion molecule isoform X3 [Clinocottus analis]|uniref:basal cell adhesion molecule isoform X3 n=1 Tax=Clinocottus analis TaxID=304258 RepID=UPI0035C10AD7